MLVNRSFDLWHESEFTRVVYPLAQHQLPLGAFSTSSLMTDNTVLPRIYEERP